MAQNQTACAFVQTIVTQDGKRQLAQLQMLEQKTAPATYILTMLLPPPHDGEKPVFWHTSAYSTGKNICPQNAAERELSGNE